MNWWETDFVAVRDNKLWIAGRDAAALAERYGTPLYVYGKDRILELYARLDDALARHSALPARICYAMKANPHRGILRLLQRRGGWVDAVSPCEVETALKAGFPAERILFTGTSVSRADLRAVFAIDGLTVNIDAAEQLDLMSEIKPEFPSKAVRVSVRWNPGIGRGFNPRVVTAGKRSSDGTPIKFGVEPKKVIGVFARARKLGFRPVGLHQHLGSGWVRGGFGLVRAAGERVGRPRRRRPPPGRGVRQGELRQHLRLRRRRDVQHRAPAGHLSSSPPRDRQRLPRRRYGQGPHHRRREPLRNGRRFRPGAVHASAHKRGHSGRPLRRRLLPEHGLELQPQGNPARDPHLRMRSEERRVGK